MFETIRPGIVWRTYHAYRTRSVNNHLMTFFCVVIYVVIDAIVVARSIDGSMVDRSIVFAVDANSLEGATLSPPLIVEGPPPNIIYSVGDRITLPCKASGKPSRFEWYYNGRPMVTSNAPNSERFVKDSSTDGTLHLKTRPQDTVGWYQCRAINDVGVAMSNVSRLEEAVFQEIGRSTRGVVKNVTVSEGRHVVLPCNHYVSHPAATVTWYSVVSAADTPSSSSSSSMSLSWTVVGALTQLVRVDERIALDERGGLVISNVGKFDELLYKCQAYNYVLRQTSGGSYHRLIVERAPYGTYHRAPEVVYASPPMNALAGSDVILTCIFSATPIAHITWTRKTGTMPRSASTLDFNRRLLLRGATSGDSGTYQCTANNSVADTQHIVSLTVDSLPTISDGLYSRDVTIGGSTSFECQGHGRPMPQYSWYINAILVEELASRVRTMSWRVKNGGRHLELYNIRLVPGFTVTCNVSNSYGHVLSAAYVIVLPVTTTVTTYGETETETESETEASHTEDASQTYSTASDILNPRETGNADDDNDKYDVFTGSMVFIDGKTTFDTSAPVSNLPTSPKHLPSDFSSMSTVLTTQGLRQSETFEDWTATTTATAVMWSQSTDENADLDDVSSEVSFELEEFPSSTLPATDVSWDPAVVEVTELDETMVSSVLTNVDKYVYDESVGGEAALIGSRVVDGRWRMSRTAVCVVSGLLSVVVVMGIIVCLRLRAKRSTYHVSELEMKNGRSRSDGLSPEEGQREKYLKPQSAAVSVAAAVPIITELTPIKSVEDEQCHL